MGFQAQKQIACCVFSPKLGRLMYSIMRARKGLMGVAHRSAPGPEIVAWWPLHPQARALHIPLTAPAPCRNAAGTLPQATARGLCRAQNYAVQERFPRDPQRLGFDRLGIVCSVPPLSKAEDR